MSKPLDELYFIWLYSQVADENVEDRSLSYWKILRMLFAREFVWVIPNDDNRMEDGRALRREFINDIGITNVDQEWMNLGCSVLELMVGLSRRLSFEADGEPHYWFWQLMENIDLARYNDSRRVPKRHVDDVIDTIIWRTYDANGVGGFFPLRNPPKNQRDVELWYQMSSYVMELD